MRIKTPLISIIVPAFKQEKTIARDLKRIINVLDKLRYKTELICVVDGMIDGTFSKALTRSTAADIWFYASWA